MTIHIHIYICCHNKEPHFLTNIMKQVDMHCFKATSLVEMIYDIKILYNIQ